MAGADCGCAIPGDLYGIADSGCGPSVQPALASLGWPGDIARLAKFGNFFTGWAPFDATFQSNATNQVVMDLKLAANCASAELVNNLAFTGNNPQIVGFLDRARVYVSPGAVEIPAGDLQLIRNSLYLRDVNPIYTAIIGLAPNTGTTYRGSTSAVGPTAAAAWLTLDRPSMDIIDDRIPPTLLEFQQDTSIELVSRLNLAAAGTYRFTLMLHGTFVGAMASTIRGRADECRQTWRQVIARQRRYLAGMAQGLDGAGGVELPRQV